MCFFLRSDFNAALFCLQFFRAILRFGRTCCLFLTFSRTVPIAEFGNIFEARNEMCLKAFLLPLLTEQRGNTPELFRNKSANFGRTIADETKSARLVTHGT